MEDDGKHNGHTKVDIKEPKQNTIGISCPWLCGGTRKSLQNFYPGPTILMHKMHWTEWVFVLFILIAVGLTALVMIDIIPVGALCGFMAMVSATALFMVWDIAKYQSLAEVADQLERLAEKNHAQIEQVQLINDDWEAGVQSAKENLEEFTTSLGFIGDDASKIDEIQRALTDLVVQKKRIQAEEKALFKVSQKHQRVTRAEIEEKQRAIMKSSLSRHYDRLDRKGDGDGTISGEQELASLRLAMEKEPFLNKKNDKGEPLYDWPTAFDEIASDGEIPKWELLDALDQCTHSYFYEIRDSVKKVEKVQAEIRRVQAEARAEETRKARGSVSA